MEEHSTPSEDLKYSAWFFGGIGLFVFFVIYLVWTLL
jgi:hypothetical protein